MPEERNYMTGHPPYGNLKLAIMGGSGRVGSALRKELAPLVRSIVVLGRTQPDDLVANETFLEVDMSEVDKMRAAFEGMDGVIHMAGIPKEAPLEDIVRVNVVGTSNLYEAARLAKVPRVILGSSNHAIGYYPRDTVVSGTAQMRPDGLYGLSKCWTELVAGLYYDKYDIKSLIIRIGNAGKQPKTVRSLEVWVSPADLCQLTLIGLTHPDVDATTVFGVSAGGGTWWDNSAATRLGYKPRDVIAEHAAAELNTEDESAVSLFYQGGRFAAANHVGAVRRR
jgi:uronate dehydrogenase